MDYSIKRTRDFYEGQIKREKEISFLNNLFFKQNIDCRFSKFHVNLKAMNTGDKARNNKAENYIEPKEKEGMGLNYKLEVGGKIDYIPFIFAYEEAGFYLKIPSNHKKDPKEYLKLLENKGFKILIVGKDSTDSVRLYSRIIDAKDLLNERIWKFKMAESEGNSNRLQFHMALSDLKYLPPTEPTLFDPPLIVQLKNLFQ